eukprot:GFUD01104041.1.p1 GENE.GFUD01104041.1~~GFUD01104041.1.p1  ORF type:complete len:204 (-),score=80.64 GFUD01104041.1:55-609(-)
MAQSQNSAVLAISLVSQHLQFWLRRVLLWLIDEEGEATVKKIVNEDSDDDDEGYNSIISTTEIEASNHRGRRRKPREEELNIVAENTKEELREKFILLREAYDDLKDVMTRLEFEVDYLKDDQDEIEEEVWDEVAEDRKDASGGGTLSGGNRRSLTNGQERVGVAKKKKGLNSVEFSLEIYIYF